MQKQANRRASIRTGSKSGIWLALLLALGLHALILVIPASTQSPGITEDGALIEVQLVQTVQQVPAPPEALILPDFSPSVVEVDEKPQQQLVETTVDNAPPQAIEITPKNDTSNDFDKLSEVQKEHLTRKILTAQFISEESVTEKIFGKQFDLQTADPQKDFYYPVRQSMIAMLDQPMPDVPFAFTANLVRFAYAPGVKGDLQRFWDVITPEFGWRTKNGTEIKCIWVLIVGGCGWK